MPDLLDRPRSLEDELAGTEGFRYIGPQGRSLKATGVATSCDYLQPIGQDTFTGSRDLQGNLGGSNDLPEAASEIENGGKMTKIMKIVKNGFILKIGLRIP